MSVDGDGIEQASGAIDSVFENDLQLSGERAFHYLLYRCRGRQQGKEAGSLASSLLMTT